jgi:serine/threonine-protein kinase SRPK3
MKVQKSGSAYAEAAVDEIHLLTCASSRDPAGGSRYVAKLTDNFQVSGPNGVHHCMVFELLGDNLLALIRHFSSNNNNNSSIGMHKFGKGIPIPLVRRLTREVLLGLDYLHRSCHIIHTDLKPENILLQRPLSEMQFRDGDFLGYSDMNSPWASDPSRATFVKVVDLGNACWTHKHFTDYITTRQYRSPEAIVELNYSSAVDIWSTACIVFELITGDYLFDPRADKNGAYTRDEDHLALMIELTSDAPEVIKKKGNNSANFFCKSGTLKNIQDLVHWPLESLLQEKVNMPKDLAREISDFLSPMLQMDPNERATAAECLKHPFLNCINDPRGQQHPIGFQNNASGHNNMSVLYEGFHQ